MLRTTGASTRANHEPLAHCVSRMNMRFRSFFMPILGPLSLLSQLQVEMKFSPQWQIRLDPVCTPKYGRRMHLRRSSASDGRECTWPLPLDSIHSAFRLGLCQVSNCTLTTYFCLRQEATPRAPQSFSTGA